MIKAVIRTFSFFGRWAAEIIRQPMLVLVLVVGPFFVLLAFGLGVTNLEPRPTTLLVIPGDNGEAIQPVVQQLRNYLDIVGIVSELDVAREQVRLGGVDMAVALPPDPIQSLRQGEHLELVVITNDIDPIRSAQIGIYLDAQIANLNRVAVQRAIEAAQEQAGTAEEFLSEIKGQLSNIRSAQGDIQALREQVQELQSITDSLDDTGVLMLAGQEETLLAPGASYLFQQGTRISESMDKLNRDIDQLDASLNSVQGDSAGGMSEELNRVEADVNEVERLLAQLKAIPPDVLGSPFQHRIENVASYVPSFVNFYAPAVLSLMLQHLAITLGGLSLARVRLLGIVELLRVSPVRTTEIVVGNYLSYGVLCALVGALLVTLLVLVLGVPILGSMLQFVAVLLLLIISALGIGYVVATMSSSEHQAAQIAMLVLLASIFFSGFVVNLERVLWPVRAISYMLPTTYAIRTLQDVMLRGVMRTPTDLLALLGFSILFFVSAIFLFRRVFKPA